MSHNITAVERPARLAEKKRKCTEEALKQSTTNATRPRRLRGGSGQLSD